MVLAWCGLCRGVHELGDPCVVAEALVGPPPEGKTTVTTPFDRCCVHCITHTELMRELLTVSREIRDRLPPMQFTPVVPHEAEG